MLSFSPVAGIGLPQPLTRRRVCPPPPLVQGVGAHSLAREGLGKISIPTRGHTVHCGTLYIYVCFVAIRILTAQGTVWGELPVRLRPLRPRGGGRRAAGVRRSRFAVSHGVHDGDTARSPARLLPVSRLRDEGATRDTSTVQKRAF